MRGGVRVGEGKQTVVICHEYAYSLYENPLESSEGSVMNAQDQTVVLSHALNAKIFDDDRSPRRGEIRRQLMGGVRALIGDVLMRASELRTRLRPVLRAFLSPGLLPLQAPEPLLGAA